MSVIIISLSRLARILSHRPCLVYHCVNFPIHDIDFVAFRHSKSGITSSSHAVTAVLLSWQSSIHSANCPLTTFIFRSVEKIFSGFVTKGFESVAHFLCVRLKPKKRISIILHGEAVALRKTYSYSVVYFFQNV